MWQNRSDLAQIEQNVRKGDDIGTGRQIMFHNCMVFKKNYKQMSRRIRQSAGTGMFHVMMRGHLWFIVTFGLWFKV